MKAFWKNATEREKKSFSLSLFSPAAPSQCRGRIGKKKWLCGSALLLLALVFLSCNSGTGSDSRQAGGGGGGNSGGGDVIVGGGVSRTVQSMRVIKMPSFASNEGMPVDLTGIEVEMRWSDRTTTIERDPTKFYTKTKKWAKV